MSADIFSPFLEKWELVAEGDPLSTHAGRLLPVRRDGVPAMLKIALEDEERRGPDLLKWWGGEGAVHVLEHGTPRCCSNERRARGRSPR